MLSGYPRRSGDAAWRVIDGEAVVARPSSNRVHVLNRSAAAAWQLLDGTRDGPGVARDLADALCRDVKSMEADVDLLLRELSEHGLVELLDEPGGAAPPRAERGAETPAAEYSPPRIKSTEELEVIAAVCASARTGGGGGNPPGPPGGDGPPGRPPGACRVFGVCQTPFE